MKTLLKNAYLVDENHDFQVLDVLVEGQKIAAVGEITQEADRVIDMTGWTLLPGFIDAHVHVAVDNEVFTEEAVKAWVQNGVTSVRELGMLSTLPADAYARWIAENNKRADRARVVATGKYIDVAGGYGAGPNPNHCVGLIISAPEEAAKAVDYLHGLGFAGIKVGISDGREGSARMTPEMFRAICDRARGHGMFVAAHLGLAKTLAELANLGITEAAHTPGDKMSDALIASLVAKGVACCTTIGDPDKAMGPPPGGMPGGPGEPGGPGGMPFEMPGMPQMDPEKMAAQRKAGNAAMKDNLKRFYDAGGLITIGTDLIHSSDFMHDAKIPVIELRQLRQAGLPFMDVIKAGTSDAARVIGTFDEEGTVEAGKLANLVAVKSRLDDSFEALNNVDFVMHYGEIIKG